jgi:hypothetical protein
MTTTKRFQKVFIFLWTGPATVAAAAARCHLSTIFQKQDMKNNVGTSFDAKLHQGSAMR